MGEDMASDRVLSDMQRAMQGALATHWRLFMVQGVALIVLGLLAIAAPVAATIVANLFIGWLLFIGGVVGLVALFSTHEVPAFLWGLLTAALSVTVGIVLIWNPLEAALTITLVLTAFFIAEGVFQIVASLAYRHMLGGSVGWMLLSGVADLLLAAVIIAGWPLSAAWALGLLVGINLLTSGWAILMAALVGRKLAENL
jgi:uncharacterized membrane protein HdeD (DUF308 family)